MDKDEEWMTNKEQAMEMRLKQGLASWKPSYREESRSDEKGKGRGKGKGKKGKAGHPPGGGTGGPDKPPAA